MSSSIRDPKQLLTTNEERAAGFALYAERRNHELLPYVERALGLGQWVRSRISEQEQRYIVPLEFEVDLAMAAGLSVKAQGHVDHEYKGSAIQTLISSAMGTSDPESYIVQRFLLSCGDALGGKMRNITGTIADERFRAAFRSSLDKRTEFAHSVSVSGHEINWSNAFGARTMRFNKLLTQTRKNQDVVVFDENGGLVAVGELKGGIDPAGADEHWKTARTSLARVRSSCGASVKIFFAGAAIETAMAQEMVGALREGSLNYVANLGKSDQVIALSEWLVNV